MRFWQIFERYSGSPTGVFGRVVPNWKSNRADAETGLKLQFDGYNSSYALLYVNLVGTLICDINNTIHLSGKPEQIEDKLQRFGIMKYAGYSNTH